MPENTMDTRGLPSPRPTPQFYREPVTFSVKKLVPAGTPKDSLPPRPPVKSCPPLSRVFPHRNALASSHAQPVTFRHNEGSLLSPKYNVQSKFPYFDQLFTDVEAIGYGSFGEVFKVKSKEDNKYYAIKKSRERFKGQFDRKRKLEEVARHETLPSHPNCIKFVRAWEENGHLYIQTELCDLSVSEYLYQNHHLPERLIWNYMVDLLLAVKHLHDHNLVHMDIKPENAMISFDGICKLGDFGLVINLAHQKDLNEPVEGDAKYLAPELLQGKCGKPADVFSLGVFFLEMCHNVEMPRDGELWHVLRSDNLPRYFFKERSSEIRTVITKMLTSNHFARPTVDQVLAMPSIRAVFKTRVKDYMFSTKQLSPVSDTTPAYTPPLTRRGVQQLNFNRDTSFETQTFSDSDDCHEERESESHSHGNSSDLLNSSDEFLMPVDPAPRRAYTTPALRRRPATTSLNGSPIKRTLFASAFGTPTRGSPTLPSPRSAVSSCPSDSSTPHFDRSSTPPPISSLTSMDCDEVKSGIEPKNLLNMFEAASDEEEI